ncbi:ankyrin repeat and SOCS box protein 2-like [Brienomyrus brachyistius]|uniref:ankyrin repeat and SOCS box protein 2-like n=1 Tax=Brienomyrus brachyistius TaxID=42636 RepID=UPI0020B2694B|nr:ankyrin repeat and SOCS box protein 2-like [Brienomyrus brachyistius]XP_048831259.1 ankyrin repeat and SOCS box protein 2-like [Brienomyrus brachyistius]XP_048831260.1 ankyrin repeat and SOCS box protein 2-like [Brienomyrus brachyistius]XP_048831261.1 ankyrin repeat and SOCS box protein 2-like [Brienomyrus brachyistius]XP_048831262.1 ankyrin repeat and SOCS box protein 2-like [Brienomyrus brachyistius]
MQAGGSSLLNNRTNSFSSGKRSDSGDAEGAVRSYSFVTGYGKRCIAWKRSDGSLFVTPEPEEAVDPVVMAIKNGDVKEVRRLVVSSPKSLTQANREGWLPLHEAAYHGQRDCIMVLLKARPELIDKRTLQEQTPVFLAVAGDHVTCVQWLLENGADPDISNKNKESPLYKACERENAEVVDLLLRFGGGVNQRCSQGWTALHEAACRNSVDICRILVQAGAKVDATNTYGVTPLFLAAQGGRLEALEFLIHNGADINGQAGDGATALYEACRNGHMDIVELLLTHNADANRPAKAGLLPLHVAAQHGHYEIVSLLIPVTSRTSVRNCGISPVHLAAEHNQDEALEVLIETGFDVNATLSGDHSGKYEDRRSTPLYFTVANGNTEAAAMLLEAGANPNLDIFSPLLLAVRQGCVDTVALLLEHGADPDVRIPTHPTAFPAAAVFCMNQPSLLRVLLDGGCDAQAFFSCEYGSDPHPPLKTSGISGDFNSSTLRFSTPVFPVSSDEARTVPLQFCEAISSPAVSRWAGPVIDLLLDYVGSVRLCSRLLQHLDSFEGWAAIKDKSASPRPLMHLCRQRIREQVGGRGLRRLATLPLPGRLLKYLNNNHSEDDC